jgi:hypothetical protein
MAINLTDANTDTPTPAVKWVTSSDAERIASVNDALGMQGPEFLKVVKILSANSDGQIIVEFREPLPADKRGTFLLNLESFLKQSIDPGLVVWLAALGDKSALRNLRGIEVKSE